MTVAAAKTFLRDAPAERLPPPVLRRGAIGWLRENLFSSPFNIALTVICVAFLLWVIPPLLRFFLFDAVWSADSR
jgi:general L-amino acid transport system permease protein